MLYINGGAGNLAPISTVYPDFESGHLSQFRVLLGAKIIDANRQIGPATVGYQSRAGRTTSRNDSEAWNALGT